jgi:hypothetical protein
MFCIIYAQHSIHKIFIVIVGNVELSLVMGTSVTILDCFGLWATMVNCSFNFSSSKIKQKTLSIRNFGLLKAIRKFLHIPVIWVNVCFCHNFIA